MARKVGRVVCGACERVVYDPAARRGLRKHEHAAWDRWDEHRFWEVPADLTPETRSKPLAKAGRIDYRNDAPWRVLRCRCGRTYAVEHTDLKLRRREARRAGSDVLLLASDLDRR